jgi:phospholipid transport system substrate-binding protein
MRTTRLIPAFRPVLLAFFAVVLMCAPAWSASENERAITFIEQMSGSALKLVANKEMATDDRRSEFASLLDANFDMDRIGRFVLGRYWRLATPEQRSAYLGLFQESIVQTYSHRFDDYSGQKFRVLGRREAKSKFIFINSEIFDPTRPGANVNVLWRVLPTGDSFRVVDVVIEGISMSVTQRNEYASVIQRNGGKVDALIDALRKNLKKMKDASDS